jgi:hypothetical protein
MDLHQHVRLKGESKTSTAYCDELASEQFSAQRQLIAPDFQWQIADALQVKVDHEGCLRPFCGDTVMFPLTEADQNKFQELQQALYHQSPELWASPLDAQYFHVTLHDLSSGANLTEIAPQMQLNQYRCQEVFKKLAEHCQKSPNNAQVALQALSVYPCCNISAVVGFLPVDDYAYRRLINTHSLFDEIVYLDYWLRPHLTLAYFKPMLLSTDQLKQLHTTLTSVAVDEYSVTLDLRKLVYCRFSNMNNYQTIFSVADFA